MIYINKPVIGFVGKKGAGKSSCAVHIANNFPCTIHPFAFRIKQVLKSLGLTTHEIMSREWRDRPHKNLSGFTVREFMQRFGTDFCRDTLDQDFWVNLWKQDIKAHVATVIVDDVRMLNEAEAVRSLGGVLIRIVNPHNDNNDLHRSETEMDQIECDYSILNNGSLEDLCKELEKLMTRPPLSGSLVTVPA